MENTKKVYIIVGNGHAYILADKVVYKPDHFQLLSDGEIVGSFNYTHSVLRPDAVIAVPNEAPTDETKGEGEVVGESASE